MDLIFYAREYGMVVTSRQLDDRYRSELWTPSWSRLVPQGLSVAPYGVWWAMHYTHTFANRDYAVFLVREKDAVIHHSLVTPRYFRFPFMSANDLQIGDVWTDERHRGKGIAAFALQQIMSCSNRTGRKFWYIVEAGNLASIRAAEKAGFSMCCKGRRTKASAISLFSAYRICQ